MGASGGGGVTDTIIALQNPFDPKSPTRQGLDATINKPSIEARKSSDALAKSNEAFANKQKADLEKRKKDEAAAAAKEKAQGSQQNARARQRALSAGAYGRSDTIITGPLGVTSYMPPAAKTALGQ
jgi:hypothetical protein